jgi:hypothetical protein
LPFAPSALLLENAGSSFSVFSNAGPIQREKGGRLNVRGCSSSAVNGAGVMRPRLAVSASHAAAAVAPSATAPQFDWHKNGDGITKTKEPKLE